MRWGNKKYFYMSIVFFEEKMSLCSPKRLALTHREFILTGSSLMFTNSDKKYFTFKLGLFYHTKIFSLLSATEKLNREPNVYFSFLL